MSEEKTGLLAGFKEFLMRGNVVELAVAVVVGTAFTKIVNSVVTGVINPVVGALGPKDLDRYESCLRGPCEWNKAGEAVRGIPIRWGTVLSASLTFLITAAVVYFLMILPMNKYQARMAARSPVDDTPPEKTEVELLTEIRDALLSQQSSGVESPVLVGAQRTAPGSGSAARTAGAPLQRSGPNHGDPADPPDADEVTPGTSRLADPSGDPPAPGAGQLDGPPEAEASGPSGRSPVDGTQPDGSAEQPRPRDGSADTEQTSSTDDPPAEDPAPGNGRT